MSTSILTRTISLPAWAKKARSSRWKKPLVGPEIIFIGGAGGKRAISSCPVGGTGHMRGVVSPARRVALKSRSIAVVGVLVT